MIKASKRKLNRPPKLSPTKPRQANLTILIDLPDSKVAESLRRSVEPETRNGKAFRSQTSVGSRGDELRIRITASDLIALRAATNSFLHFVAVGLKGVAAVAPFYRGKKQKIPSSRVP